MRAAVVAVVVVAISACGPAAPPKPPPPQPPQPLAAADLAGPWEASDLDGWRYALTITGETYTQAIERGARGACLQKGTLAPYESAYGAPYTPPNGDRAGFAGGGGETAVVTKLAFVLSLAENTCNADFAGAQLVVIASDYHGATVQLRTTLGYAGGVEESRVYTRVVPPPSTPK
jgi:hypothetical protein